MDDVVNRQHYQSHHVPGSEVKCRKPSGALLLGQTGGINIGASLSLIPLGGVRGGVGGG